MELLTVLDRYQSEALESIQSCSDSAALEDARILFLGKKKGRLKDLQSELSKATPEERPVIGKRFNEVKKSVEAAVKQRQQELAKPAVELEAFDVTLPGVRRDLGKRHPITQTISEFKDIAGRLGFAVTEGPEVEDDYHNFVALNIPEEHPARDPLDNFYLAVAGAQQGGPWLLRSQTSTVQIRVMEKTAPPVRIVSTGRVYRPDTIDATHSCMFHQMEGLYIDKNVTMSNLKTVLKLIATQYLGDDIAIRFRPSFFPFTEPSVEVDIQWGDSWMEVGGAGMVDPNVLRAVGYDPEEVSGFAFGLGIERLCMKRYGIRDIRLLFENDVRFLSQF
ncbi:MAG: phenylalanine--tRNA ligase subunit alpha [Rubinisphaera brasiliensis]|uniref:Phenylalanine--tRNA ligase alpha subunit n=1 Tax=Rubinisphaera brasiliensis (strain ATCC 49424 / DSM 5305 / JCM 21570 / IAM 15109 / NBRC 103401 / IFAM 1448) TaxID=756272 RepID=F0SQV1_RUBBR|nr:MULTISPECIES: phenylalanine--tRNA ligase subunit alpha [Rubinisphaera]ADY60172.1 phenylalanyl-tRNA synthetase, alpha subunit [Rubinisphaera brasiliensis DSM 5305]MBB02903.1 phenylalanine--tRNA ligase subunit alpha [Planctomyces sp.]MBR9802567.1 phenylalanine--tRNA ligase subunit alpha [bacterium]